MSIFVSADLMHRCYQTLFDRVEGHNPDASQDLVNANVAVRIVTTDPTAEVTFDGRQSPLAINFGPSTTTADIEIGLSADTLHCILLGEIGLRKAMGGGLLDIKGPIWKLIGLLRLFEEAKRYYPEVLNEYGLPGHCPAEAG